ncbi:transglutaminase domain-containing protein [Mucilaginibacter mali]|uniref:Transglutaminase domain-containing protein n=1 Tax=Mucilaginibacter mali TaxID=2740462 RepID=A0A7D4Q0S6_9SPHI|nr:transglutaminase domain-containing protein [Mucilaginibacter mali]QKJ30006.1 transglutaminase domain-containing protein [Mucilaginibacter mali]
MKKLALLCVFCVAVGTTYAQQQQPTDEFGIFNAKVEAERYAASQKQDYTTADKVLLSWIDKYDNSPDAVKLKYKGYRGNIYYNLACYESLLGHKENALTAFEKCQALGYNDYAHTITDTDLNNLHQEKRYLTVVQAMREKGDMGYVLQKSGAYKKEKAANAPAFSYQSANTPELVKLKNTFNLDSVAGNKDEISKFKNLLYWAHNQVKHDGSSSNPLSRNAIDLIAVCKKENRGVNCRMMATILRDAYQAEGFQTRVVTCMPKDTLDNDCHVITVVWSKTLNKWLWMDPTFNAYVTDTKGNLLNIEEVRERLVRSGTKELVLNDDANWNNQNKQTKDYYLGYYMSKNLYWLQCAAKSEWDIETAKTGKAPIQYINLYPGSFTTLHISGGSVKESNRFATTNPTYFWQKPAAL